MRFQIPVLSFVFSVGIMSGIAGYADADPSLLFREFTKAMDRSATALLDRLAKAPDSTLNPFRDDRKSLHAKLDQVLLETAQVLGNSELTDLKAQADQLIRESASDQAEISELMFKFPGAPETKSPIELRTLTRAEIQRQVKADRDKIEARAKSLWALKKQMSDVIYSSQHIRLQAPQIDVLLYTVTGDDDLKLISVYNNMKILGETLRQAMQSSGGDLGAARRYYSVYCLSLRTLLALQQDYLNKVDHKYLPELQRLLAENDKLKATAQAKLEDPGLIDSEIRAGYQSNLDSLALSRSAIQRYLEILQANRERMATSLGNVQARYDLAENKYFVVEEATQLLQLVQESQSQFNSLLNLQVPPMAAFSLQESAAFTRLTDDLKKN